MKRLILLGATLQLAFAGVATVPITSGETISKHIEQKEKQYYKLTLPSTKDGSIKIKLSQLDADVDLYVKTGSLPTIPNNDCYSANSYTKDEACSYDILDYGENKNEVYIMVYGFRSSSYKLVAEIDKGENIPLLEKSTNGRLKKNEINQYYIQGKEDSKYSIKLETLDNGGDADLRVKIGKKANFQTLDCKSTRGGTKTDECIIKVKVDNQPYMDAHKIYIHLHGYRATRYKLSVTRIYEYFPTEKELINEARKKCQNNQSVKDGYSILCSDEKDIAYIIYKNSNAGPMHKFQEGLYYINMSQNSSYKIITQKSYEDGWYGYEPINSFGKEYPPFYTVNHNIQGADPHGTVDFMYHEKAVLHFPYYEKNGYLKTIKILNGRKELYVEFDNYDADIKYTELYDISDPSKPKRISRTKNGKPDNGKNF
jgi:hypothetical protein